MSDVFHSHILAARAPRERRTFDAEGMSAWLRRRYPRNTVEHVAADTGIPISTVQNYLLGRSEPVGEYLLRLIEEYGRPFLLAVFKKPPAWLADPRREEKVAQLRERFRAIDTDMRDLFSAL